MATNATPLQPLRVAVARAVKAGDAEKVAATRRALAAAKLEDYIRRTVETAPPLTAEQRARLANLLRSTPGESAVGGGADG